MHFLSSGIKTVDNHLYNLLMVTSHSFERTLADPLACPRNNLIAHLP